MKILVIGGTGTVGSCLVADLLRRGTSVRVMTRNPERGAALPKGAEAAVADIVADPYGAAEAFRDVDAVFMLNASSLQETAEGLLAVRLAQEAGVRRFVYQSTHCLEQFAHVPHLAPKMVIQRAVLASGMEHSLICPNHFFQNDRLCKVPLVEHGLYVQPIGDVGCWRVDVRDIAEAAAIVLTEDGHHGKSYNLVGPQNLTGEDCAAIWAGALDKDIRYVGDIEAWQGGVKPFMPAWLLFDLGLMYHSIAADGMLGDETDVDRLSALLGRPPRSFSAYAAEMAASWEA